MEKDITRRAVERAAQIMLKAKVRLHQIVPLGPTSVRPTAEELRRLLEKAPPGTLDAIAQAMGPEAALRMLSGRDDGKET